jgi:hypothetical protein
MSEKEGELYRKLETAFPTVNKHTKQVLDEAKKEIFANFPQKEITRVKVGGDGEEYNEDGYSEDAIRKLYAIIKEWFGEPKKP